MAQSARYATCRRIAATDLTAHPSDIHSPSRVMKTTLPSVLRPALVAVDLANVVVQQDGDALTGTYRGRGNRVATLAGVVTAETVEFSLENEETGTAPCVGTIRERSMEGTCDYGAPCANDL